MIGTLKGSPVLSAEKYLIVDVAGVGYKVFGTPEMLRASKDMDEVLLFTYLVVREDTLDLYGFETILEKDFFELLLSVSGIGPRSALSILSVAPVDTLQQAIGSGDTTYLTKVSGIGKKIAEKVVIELRDKLSLFANEATNLGLRAESDVIEALKALGYSQNEAREALQRVSSEITDINTKIKEALKILGK